MQNTVYLNNDFSQDCEPRENTLFDTGNLPILNPRVPIPMSLGLLGVDLFMEGQAALGSRHSICTPSNGKGGADLTAIPRGRGSIGGGISAGLPFRLAGAGVQAKGSLRPRVEVRGSATSDEYCREIKDGYDPLEIEIDVWWSLLVRILSTR
jgi:hypothetical protein